MNLVTRNQTLKLQQILEDKMQLLLQTNQFNNGDAPKRVIVTDADVEKDQLAKTKLKEKWEETEILGLIKMHMDRLKETINLE